MPNAVIGAPDGEIEWGHLRNLAARILLTEGEGRTAHVAHMGARCGVCCSAVASTTTTCAAGPAASVLLPRYRRRRGARGTARVALLPARHVASLKATNTWQR